MLTVQLMVRQPLLKPILSVLIPSTEATRAYWSQLDQTRKLAFRFHHISTDEVYGDLEVPMTYLLKQHRMSHQARIQHLKHQAII